MVNLESLDPLKVDFRVPELALSQVKNGQDAADHARRASRTSAYDGRVVAINPLIDANGPLDRDPRAGAEPRRARCAPACSRACGSSPASSKDSVDGPRGSRSSPWATTSTSTRWSTARRGARRWTSASAATARVEVVSGLGAGRRGGHRGRMKLREGVAVRVANTPAAGATPGARRRRRRSPRAEAMTLPEICIKPPGLRDRALARRAAGGR